MTLGEAQDNTIATGLRNAAGSILVNGDPVPARGCTPTLASSRVIQVFGGNNTIAPGESTGGRPYADLFA